MVESKDLYLGIDVGSVSVNTVVIDKNRVVLEEYYTRTMGQPLKTVRRVLEDIFSHISKDRIRAASLTGTAGKLVSDLIGGNFVNEIIAQTKSVELLYPQIKTVIEIGGEDSKLILLDRDQKKGKTKIVDFAMNTMCAAGTGSFLDQQAHRLNLNIEEFGRLALRSETPPRIAGRCSVFAKTDMIHLQQSATPDFDIVAGLCYALARNFKSNIGKGKTFVPPVSFQGGVAANVGMRKAFTDVLNFNGEELVIPKHFASMGAIGAVFITMEDPNTRVPFLGLKKLFTYMETHKDETVGLEPLFLSEGHRKKLHVVENRKPSEDKRDKIDAFLGIDVGSISTNVVVIDRDRNLLAKRYLMTAGRPIEAIRQGLKEVGEEIGDYINIRGAGTTGSGRYLTGDFIGADIIKNEITAQATAAMHIDPNVDTIFEIGGQDSKYIHIENGTIVDFEMNKVCAAGTGSFLEEQAEKLGISIKDEFGNLALSASSPVPLGERCTVFMESDLIHHQQKGASKGNLVAGLGYSIAVNYLNKVVGDRKIGERIFFQGATAFNLGVVAAFELLLGKPITVPLHNEVTGAIGMAILAMEVNENKRSTFKGFDLSDRHYDLNSFECQGCSNMCEIRKLTIKGERPLFYGSRCEKYEIDKKKKEETNLPDLFAEREDLLMNICRNDDGLDHKAPIIGIPKILFFHELYPLWKTFFTELGFRVVFTENSNKKIIHQGLESTVAETCFPIKVSHGHVLELMEKGVKRIFLPSIINMSRTHPDMEHSYNCPYVQAFPYTVQSAIDFKKLGVDLLHPVIQLGRGRDGIERPLLKMAKKLQVPKQKVKAAISKAMNVQNSFYSILKTRGEETLQNLKKDQKAVVIVSRAYNGCDSGINLDLPKKLRDLGILPIPMDYLPIEGADLRDVSGHMYWKYGQRFLGAAQMIKSNPNLYAIYITNFACGPDSFISHFFRNKIKEKPYLQIEIDEHSADVGAITRLEAFLDTLENLPEQMETPKRKTPAPVPAQDSHFKKRKIYVPYMSDHALPLSAAVEACGIPSAVIPESNEETLELGRRWTSGKECYPCILTTGNMIRMLKEPDFDREKSAFFMPSTNGPCRFGQYHSFQRMVLDEMGYEDVPIYAFTQDERIYEELGTIGKDLVQLAWQGIVAIDILEKKLRSTRPYEKVCGETERVYRHFTKKISDTIRNKGDVLEILREARQEFERIDIIHSEERPIIGIVGEIYIRSNSFSNENIVSEIERLGGEVWLPPFSEWVFYINFTSQRRSLRDRNYRGFLNTYLTEFFQRKQEHKLEAAFDGTINNLKEPPIKKTLKYARPYLDWSFEGEAILSMGKVVDFYKKGVSGIINVMPFTCMPGTIVSALLKRYREDQGNIPVLNMAYDGQENTNTQTRLEAFIYQVRQYRDEMQKR
ncbi:MAG: acyl-CoA dehydratase activase [Thermodesulfobacteriota bacterium]|nr:acyl-CoA dehydratase activase [Thermodesulfobacteriota bacterium]